MFKLFFKKMFLSSTTPNCDNLKQVLFRLRKRISITPTSCWWMKFQCFSVLNKKKEIERGDDLRGWLGNFRCIWKLSARNVM